MLLMVSNSIYYISKQSGVTDIKERTYVTTEVALQLTKDLAAWRSVVYHAANVCISEWGSIDNECENYCISPKDSSLGTQQNLF